MGLIIQKYGGSSVADNKKILAVAEYIKQTVDEGNWVVAVVSARGEETDRLIQDATEICGGPPPKEELDSLLSTGEIQSASLLAMALEKRFNLPAISLTGWDIELIADSERKVKRVGKVGKVKELLDEGKVAVVAGFQGIEEKTKRVITLGRGGSDLTAIALAAALGTDYCEIYTDVDGVYTIDPRIVSKAKRFPFIDYRQMIELSQAGVGVLMDRSVFLAQNLGVKIRVLFSPSLGQSSGGTLVCSGGTLEEMEGSIWIQPGVAIQKGRQIKISDVPNRPGIASKIFGVLSDINILDSTQVPGIEKTDISLLCLSEDLTGILSKLHEIRESGLVGEIKLSEPLEVAGLTLIYPLMKEEPGYLWRVFEAISRAGVNIEMFASSGTTILAVVKEEDLEKAAQALGEDFKLLN